MSRLADAFEGKADIAGSAGNVVFDPSATLAAADIALAKSVSATIKVVA
jgi:hypothetical protein